MKAGTTWLYDVLGRHPQVQVAPEKEVHYCFAAAQRPGLLSPKARLQRARGHLAFDPGSSAISRVQARADWTARWLSEPVDDAWFNALFQHRPDGAWMADFSNLNALLSPRDWRALRAKCDGLRVLYTLRHPLERLWSHVRFHLHWRGESAALDAWSLEELVDHIEAGDYLEHGDYVAAIDRMRAALAPEMVHIDQFDRISDDPVGYVRDIEQFLGISAQPLPDTVVNRVVNAAPRRAMPPGLSERLRPFVDAQLDGLRARGIAFPATWT